MRIILFTCAESAAIDQATNRVSIFHVIEEILSPVLPGAWPQMLVVAVGIREDGEPSVFNMTLRVTLTGREQPLLEGPFMIDFQNRPRARALGQIAGLVLPGPGVLRFAIFYGDREMAAWDINVTQIGAPVVINQPAPVAPAGVSPAQ